MLRHLKHVWEMATGVFQRSGKTELQQKEKMRDSSSVGSRRKGEGRERTNDPSFRARRRLWCSESVLRTLVSWLTSAVTAARSVLSLLFSDDELLGVYNTSVAVNALSKLFLKRG